MFESASQSTVLTGIANVGGTIAALVLAYKFVQWCFAFLVTAYRRSIKTAWVRYRRRVFAISVFCALDVQYLISALSRRLIMAFMGLFTVSIMQDRSEVSIERYNSTAIKSLFDNYEHYVSVVGFIDKQFLFASVIVFLFSMFRIFQSIVLVHNVQRLRIKWRRRKRHSRVSGKSL